MFTEEQITFLEQLIDQRIAQSKRPLVNTDKPYHTVPELRKLIMDNLQALKARFRNREFKIEVFRFILAEYTKLRPGDEELNGDEKHGRPRWDQQVGNAVTAPWPNEQSPFVRIDGKDGTYRFVDEPFAL